MVLLSSSRVPSFQEVHNPPHILQAIRRLLAATPHVWWGSSGTMPRSGQHDLAPCSLHMLLEVTMRKVRSPRPPSSFHPPPVGDALLSCATALPGAGGADVMRKRALKRLSWRINGFTALSLVSVTDTGFELLGTDRGHVDCLILGCDDAATMYDPSPPLARHLVSFTAAGGAAGRREETTPRPPAVQP